MRAIEVEGLCKSFVGNPVLKDVSFSIPTGGSLCLFGPSGCGKTTLLRILAGLETPDKGRVVIHGATMNGHGVQIPPDVRSVGMVFQDFALWPHMRVARHLDFVLRGRGLKRAQRRERAHQALETCDLLPRAKAFPCELSGGEAQRLAIARALVVNPRILLLDEPFANLDDALTAHIAGEIERRRRAQLATVIIATHNRDEADAFSDEVLVMPRPVDSDGTGHELNPHGAPRSRE